ncbi:acyl carrier protein [Romeria aff. gracilis LEGE 07310]|uniref:Acyl carrier protein n=1 Tax=Vasconcelosia minhoensis LEGE 07310 TaxID=915328 RepID=A0A8J7AD28_9CYAN|nr:acyl carrier protein [Romeria gracilis]MBE9077339.1 acyl carrier protein [Romeria aff. gracilis LEGE 07310]
MNPTKTTQSHSAEAIQDWLIAQMAQRLDYDADEIDIHEPFDNYDLDSAQAMGMLGQLETWLGYEFNPVLIFNYPTIAELAERLAEETQA